MKLKLSCILLARMLTAFGVGLICLPHLAAQAGTQPPAQATANSQNVSASQTSSVLNASKARESATVTCTDAPGSTCSSAAAQQGLEAIKKNCNEPLLGSDGKYDSTLAAAVVPFLKTTSLWSSSVDWAAVHLVNYDPNNQRHDKWFRAKRKAGVIGIDDLTPSNARSQSGTTSSSVTHTASSAGRASTTPCSTAECYKAGGLDYLLLGGIEQSDLSAQDSVTQGFYDLYMEEPLPDSAGSLWFRSRYLGTPSSSDKQNILAAATDPTGTLTATNLPKSVTAVDYLIGYQFRWGVADPIGKVTLNPVIAFGGTSPLSATSVVSAFQVPDYGTAECSELHKRFTAAKGYSPALPASGVDSSGQTDCVMMPSPSGTAGTKIGYLGFSNEDRSNFLSKWAVGVRLRDRWFVKQDDTSTYCSEHCPSLYADFVVGQDEAFTRGMLRHFVFKADARIPIQQTGLYFFASSINRFERNSTLSPLILSPVALATSTASTACTPSKTTVCYPSANVLIFPYKQPDRDYYRIGIGIDAIKVLTQLFNPSAQKKNSP